MNYRSAVALWLLGGIVLPAAGRAQETTIRGATPAVVLEHLKTRLSADGFVLEKADKKRAMFTLDRGMVAQRNPAMPLVHVVIELEFRFKERAEGLVVTARKEAVGERGRPMEFRRPIESDRENLQRFLDAVRVDVEAGALSADSAARRDSTRP